MLGPTTQHGYQKCVVLSKYGVCVSKDCAVQYPFICKLSSKNTTDFPTAYPPTTPAVTVPCDTNKPDDGWVADPSTDRSTCYHFSLQEELSWTNAQNKCVSLGGSLTSIHSTDTNNFIVTNLIHNEAWIGYNSIYAGDWEWSDGSNVGFNRWALGGEKSHTFFTSKIMRLGDLHSKKSSF